MTEIRVGQTTLNIDAESDEVRVDQLLGVIDAESDEVRISQVLLVVDALPLDAFGPKIQVI